MDKTEWKLYGALYGNEAPPSQAEVDAAIKRRSSGRLTTALGYQESEATAQAKLVAWMRKQNILFYHVPNGGYREKKEAWALRGQGVQAGVPDIVIPIARKGHHGLYLELKRENGGVLSVAQKWWLDQLTKEGHKAIVAHGFMEAQKIIIEYLYGSN